MIYPKFSDMRQVVMDDLDLNEEVFIQPSSFINYYNEAVSFVEPQIHTLYEDYFKSLAERDTVVGQKTIDLPSNVYANKIRKIYWFGTEREDRYEIVRFRDLRSIMFAEPNDRYRYDLVNKGVTNDIPLGTQMQVYPPFRDATNYQPLKIYYLRSANRYLNETSVCDIPEFSDVINQYVRYRCRKKEGHPLTDMEKADLSMMIATMIETLKQRVPDENDEILKDMSFYDDYDPYLLMF